VQLNDPLIAMTRGNVEQISYVLTVALWSVARPPQQERGARGKVVWAVLGGFCAQLGAGPCHCHVNHNQGVVVAELVRSSQTARSLTALTTEQPSSHHCLAVLAGWILCLTIPDRCSVLWVSIGWLIW